MSGLPLARRLFAEFLGTALLVTTVVGSGVMATQLSPTDVGLQLLENSVATMLALAVLIVMLGPVSGAHFNPVVSLVDWWLGRRHGTGIAARPVPQSTTVEAGALEKGQPAAHSWTIAHQPRPGGNP